MCSALWCPCDPNLLYSLNVRGETPTNTRSAHGPCRGGGRSARGVRNTVGFDFDPTHPERLYFTDNGADWLGDAQPPDEPESVPPVSDS